MDRIRLHQEVVEKRRFMFEQFEDNTPDYVEEIIRIYLSASPSYLEQLEANLEIEPLKLFEVQRLIMKLRGSSACIGAENVIAAVDQMWELFKKNDFDRLSPAFEIVKSEYASLQHHLGDYAELLKQQRGDAVPPAVSSETIEEIHNNEETGSVDSNETKKKIDVAAAFLIQLSHL